ncbi:MAG: hypothetical protein AAF614_26835 [Chloroflexota bacterium]
MQIKATKPLIDARYDPSLEGNVNGPSLIRVPDWVPNRLGRYYLYFAHHEGKTIRLAYADDLYGPWHLHPPGALRLEESLFPTTPPKEADVHPIMRQLIAEGKDGYYPHIASPDVHVDEAQRQFRLYYHGRLANGAQMTRVALSSDGLRFQPHPDVLGRSYFRVFRHGQAWYALVMPGQILRSEDGLTNFAAGPRLFNEHMRHSGLLKQGNRLLVFWTQVGDTPERIWLSTIDLSDDWQTWRESEPVEIHRPRKAWEGVNLPLEPSLRGSVMEPVNQLRDPAIFSENSQHYLLYSYAGEQGIGIGRLLL